MANNLRPEATRGTFAATPLTVSRKQMFIPVHAKPGGFVAMTRMFLRPPEKATSPAVSESISLDPSTQPPSPFTFRLSPEAPFQASRA